MVSIIVPAFNAEKTIRASVDSVLAQTYPDWELIIINDASRDNTCSCIPNDPRIVVVTNRKNEGVAKSRNIGIGLAKGDVLAFLDADDLWHKDKLKSQLHFMEENNADISYTATAYITETGDISSNYILHAEKKLTYKLLLKANLMSCSSVMVRKNVMVPFPEGSYIHEDYVVWLKIVKSVGQAYGLDEPLLIYRMVKGSKSSNRILSAQMTINAYRQLGYGLIQSFILTIAYAVHSITKRAKISKGM